ncbi:MAG: flagellar hook-length control protein FliK [Acetobacteraceae bacterium]|nr:MAG: flagellar hook-length control protein FliK [Acetobacteraceae bacterium]
MLNVLSIIPVSSAPAGAADAVPQAEGAFSLAFEAGEAADADCATRQDQSADRTIDLVLPMSVWAGFVAIQPVTLEASAPGAEGGDLDLGPEGVPDVQDMGPMDLSSGVASGFEPKAVDASDTFDDRAGQVSSFVFAIGPEDDAEPAAPLAPIGDKTFGFGTRLRLVPSLPFERTGATLNKEGLDWEEARFEPGPSEAEGSLIPAPFPSGSDDSKPAPLALSEVSLSGHLALAGSPADRRVDMPRHVEAPAGLTDAPPKLAILTDAAARDVPPPDRDRPGLPSDERIVPDRLVPEHSTVAIDSTVSDPAQRQTMPRFNRPAVPPVIVPSGLNGDVVAPTPALERLVALPERSETAPMPEPLKVVAPIVEAAAKPTARDPVPSDPVVKGDAAGWATGIWERLFAGVITAHPYSTTTPVPVMPVPAGAVPVLTAGGSALPTPDADPGMAVDEMIPEDGPAGSAPATSHAGAVMAPTTMLGKATGGTPVLPVSTKATHDDPLDLDDGPVPFLPMPGAALPGAPGSGAAQAGPALPVPQVATQIATALAQHADGSTDLVLSPEELGEVRLKLKPDAGNPDRMVVMITFDRPETLELFRRHAGELADALRSAGYAGADIGFGQEGSFTSGSDRQDDRGSFAQSSPLHIEPSDTPPRPGRMLAGASLDLRL